MNLRKIFINHCEINKFEINKYQLDIIDDLKKFYKENFKNSFFQPYNQPNVQLF